VRKQPFYVPIDTSEFVFGEGTPCYEGTVLFIIGNSQYLVTCLAFSVAKPFRKPFWTNRPFLVCVIILIIMESLLLFLPLTGGFSNFFGLLEFKDDFHYRYIVLIGILINAIVTVVAEKLIVHQLTRKWDRKNELKKAERFSLMMEDYRQRSLNFNDHETDVNQSFAQSNGLASDQRTI